MVRLVLRWIFELNGVVKNDIILLGVGLLLLFGQKAAKAFESKLLPEYIKSWVAHTPWMVHT